MPRYNVPVPLSCLLEGRLKAFNEYKSYGVLIVVVPLSLCKEQVVSYTIPEALRIKFCAIRLSQKTAKYDGKSSKIWDIMLWKTVVFNNFKIQQAFYFSSAFASAMHERIIVYT